MKIDINTLKFWLGEKIIIEDFIEKLTFVGFESFCENNIINITIPYNRANCNNLFDIINETSGLIDLNFFNKKKILNIYKNKKKDNIFDIKINNKNFCPYYSYILLNNFNNSLETPDIIKETLINNNINTNNFVVDILNYVTVITGLPFHAYDADKIQKKIFITKNNKERDFLTINNKVIHLKKGTFIIQDNDNNIIAIPGIIGANISKTDKESKNILIEQAIFEKKTIDKICKKYKINTFSSNIFEKGLNIQNCDDGLNFLIFILNDYIKNNVSYFLKKKDNILNIKRKINLYKKNILNICGFLITDSDIEKALINRNFFFEKINDFWQISIPYNRYDILLEVNIISEILKFFGYNNIPEKKIKTKININNSIEFNIKEKISNYLISYGFNEVINYSFVNYKIETFLFQKSLILLKNPISEQMDCMRSSLLQGLIKNLNINLNRDLNSINLFEIGNTWNKKLKTSLKCACISTNISLYKNYYSEENTFFILKNFIENIIINFFKKKNIIFKKSTYTFLNKEVSANIFINKINIGVIGLIHDKIKDFFNIKEKIFFLELDLNKIKQEKKIPIFKNISKFPKTDRDISFILQNNITYYKLFIYLNSIKINNLKNFFLNNIFYIENNTKSITIRFIFQNINRTLIDSEINKEINLICKKIKRKFSATIKGT